MLTGDILRRSAARFPDKIAIIGDGTRMTYRAFEDAANRFAQALRARGLKKGDKAAILCGNVPAYGIVYFGAAKAGVVLANLSVRATPEDVRYMLDKAEVRLFIVEEDLAASVAGVLPEIATLEHVLVVGDADKAGIAGAEALESVLAEQPSAEPQVDLADTDPLAITFTGGTTGKPKAVLVSHRARFTNNITGAIQFGVSERDTAAVATPLFHAAGLFVWFQLAVFLGLTCVLLREWEPAAFIDAVEGEGVTAVFMVPTQITDLIRDPAFDPARLANLRSIDFAGAPIRLASLREAMARLPQVTFTEHLGQSETGPIALRHAWDPDDKVGSVGRPAIGVELRVVDEEGHPVAPGQVGEIVTRGEHLLMEYYKDSAQTAALYRTGDGWLWTGDLATVDEDGFITLVDRSKDMIISGGENIYPREIEDALYGHAAVAECAVFGIPDDRFGEVPAAHVVLGNGGDVSVQDLIDFCASRVASFKRPRLIKFVDAIPKTPVGKIQKHLIRAPYWAGHDRRV